MQIPVVVSGVGGLREMVSDGENGIHVEPGNVQQLANALHRLAIDPSLRRRMGALPEGMQRRIFRRTSRRIDMQPCMNARCVGERWNGCFKSSKRSGGLRSEACSGCW